MTDIVIARKFFKNQNDCEELGNEEKYLFKCDFLFFSTLYSHSSPFGAQKG